MFYIHSHNYLTVYIKHIAENNVFKVMLRFVYFRQKRLPRPGFARPKMCLKKESMIQHKSSTLICPLTMGAKRAKTKWERIFPYKQ